jgi:hypothetical protein
MRIASIGASTWNEISLLLLSSTCRNVHRIDAYVCRGKLGSFFFDEIDQALALPQLRQQSGDFGIAT